MLIRVYFAVLLALILQVATWGQSPRPDASAWTDLTPPPFSVMQDGIFLTDRIGLMSGEKTYRTTDGGKFWKIVSNAGFWKFSFANASTGFAVSGGWNGPPGLVYKTSDGGVTWEKVFDGPIGLMSVVACDENIVMAGSPWKTDTLWRSADGGKTWSTITGAGSDVHSLLRVDDHTILTVNLSGRIARSTDAGLTWKVISTITKTAHSSRMVMSTDGTLYLTGGKDLPLMRSVDQGVTWSAIAESPTGGVTLAVTPDGLILLANRQGIWEGSTHDNSWRLAFETTNSINAFSCIGQTTWAIGGVFGKYGFTPVTTLLRRDAKPTRVDPATQGVALIDFQMPFDGNATMVIDDMQGHRLRNLFADEPHKLGKNSVAWDGRDEWGNVVAPGSYLWRGLAHQPFHINYQFSFNSPANPPWSNAQGTGGWISDHTNVQSVAASAGRIYAACPFAEEGTRLIAIDPTTGKKIWGENVRRLTLGNHYGGIAIALAADEKYVYAAMQTAEAGIGFYRLDAATGLVAPFERTETGKTVRESEHICIAKPLSRMGPIVALETLAANHAWDASTAAGSLRGCAVDGARIYLSSYWDDKIHISDKTTAAEIKTISVHRPAGIAARADGQLLVISDQQILLIDVETSASKTLVSQGILTAPIGIACERDGSFHVSQRGNAMRVLSFSPDGKPRRTVGIAGGRPASGAFDSSGMLMPNGLAVDDVHRLWVAEEDFAPRRISVWKTDGQFDRHFIGCSTYGATGAAINPDDPTMAIDTGTIFKINWEKGSYEPVYSLPRLGADKGAIFGWPAVGSAANPHGRARFFRFQNRQFLLREEVPCTLYEHVGDRWIARAAFGTVRMAVHNIWNNFGDASLDLSCIAGIDPLLLGKPIEFRSYLKVKDMAFLWIDENGDGLCQSDEVQTDSQSVPAWSRVLSLDHDLNLVVGAMHIPRSGWSGCGAPIYRMADLKYALQNSPEHPNGFETFFQTNSGWFIANGGAEAAWKNSATPQIPGLLAGYDSSGERRWFYPTWYHVHGSHHAPSPRAGLVAGDWYFGGSVDMGTSIGDVFHVMGNLGQHYLFTADGLYVSSLFQDGRVGAATPAQAVRGMNVDRMTNHQEGWGSGFFRNKMDKNIYVISNLSHADAPCISQVIGLESIHRLDGGTINISAAQVARAAEFPAKNYNNVPPSPLAIPRVNAPLVIDGKLDDWDMHTAVGIAVDEKRGATVALSCDENHLYLAYKVRDPNPLRNAGTDPAMMFKTGTVLDLMLATNSKASGRAKPIAGDLRISMSVIDNKPVAVIYRPVSPGAVDGSSFSSPNQSTHFDSVHVLTQFNAGFTRATDSFTFEAAIPWSEIGWKPAAGETTLGDVGIIYADDTGAKNILRSYWSNKNATLVSDVAAESILEPSQWGEFVFMKAK